MQSMFRVLCFSIVLFSTMVYASEPNFLVSPTEFSWAVYEDDVNPNPGILTITNNRSETLNWEIPDANLIMMPNWLTITPTSGTLEYNESKPVTLSADIADLSGGQYSYSFQVSGPAAQNTPQSISVNLLISNIKGDFYVPWDYPTIQAAIDAASNGDTIIVLPGTYYENINFYGKDIILMSGDPNDPSSDIAMTSTIIDGGTDDNGSVVTFSGSETANCILRGFTITNGEGWLEDGGGIHGGGTFWDGTSATISDCLITGNLLIGDNCIGGPVHGGGIFNCDGLIRNCIIRNNSVSFGYGAGLYGCDGTIVNCTIVKNAAYDFGCGGLEGSNGTITNCILWNNIDYTGEQIYDSSIPSFSCIQDWTGGGTGNITSDPLFANLNSNDYHLKSEYGRWDDPNSLWVYDDVTSPCIDTGMPWDGLSDPNQANDWRAELWPHGKRINMGAYGGTPQASMSGNPVGNVADLDHNDEVDVLDLELLSKDWLYAEYLLDTDLNRDGLVDFRDFSLFGQQWLWIEP